jgi:hypothetical protein
MGIFFLKSEASRPDGVKLIVLVRFVNVPCSRKKISQQKFRYSLMSKIQKNGCRFSGYLTSLLLARPAFLSGSTPDRSS